MEAFLSMASEKKYLVIFRSRLREGIEEEYGKVAKRMADLVKTVPGFIAYKSFSATNGERVTIAEFESESAIKAWRDHPEHKEAQRLGQRNFYACYRVQVAAVERDYGMNLECFQN
jgi:heme-degrading monooxygenase HmoA